MTATPVVAGQAVHSVVIVVCFHIARCNLYTWFCPFLFHRISIISDSFFCGQATEGRACQFSYSAHCVYPTINAVQKRRIPPTEILRQDTPVFILLRQEKRTELTLSVCLSVCRNYTGEFHFVKPFLLRECKTSVSMCGYRHSQ